MTAKIIKGLNITYIKGINEQTNTNMQLVYKFDINHSDRLCAICRVTNNLYNQALYIVRNELKDNDRGCSIPTWTG